MIKNVFDAKYYLMSFLQNYSINFSGVYFDQIWGLFLRKIYK